ncbi:MAG TPA: hypothetical protein VI756_17575, partial [Blastocatellia bacterium]
VALYGLSGEDTVSVAPDGNEFLVCGKPDASLIDMSQALRWRDLAYKLMVIERAAGMRFRLPSSYSSEEVGKISFVYQAITRRSFEWPIFNVRPGLPVPLQATPADQQRVRGISGLAHCILVLSPLTDTISGEHIELGGVRVRVRRPIFLDPRELLNELAVGDGHQVIGQLTSLEGSLKITPITVPRLPGAPWNDLEQKFIDAGPFLTKRLADEYSALAASTLAGLSDDEKAELTERPELDVDSFIGQEEGEQSADESRGRE